MAYKPEDGSEPWFPETLADLPPLFRRMGEPRWRESALDYLDRQWFEAPRPASDDELAALRARIGVPVPERLELLLRELGPLWTDGLELWPPEKIDWMQPAPFHAYMREEDRLRVGRLLSIALYAGEHEYGLDVDTGQCVLCSHDPPGLAYTLASVDALVRFALLTRLTEGAPEIDAAVRAEFGFVL